MMPYTAHLQALDQHVWSDLHRRPWALTGRARDSLARASKATEWVRVSQRELAAHLGYSLHGVNRWLHSMRKGGLLAVRTRRGRYGGTWIRGLRRVLAQLSAVNVPERRHRTGVDSVDSADNPANRSGTLTSRGDPERAGVLLWRSLGAQLKALTR